MAFHSKTLNLAVRNLALEQRRIIPYLVTTVMLGAVMAVGLIVQQSIAWSAAPGREMLAAFVVVNLVALTVYAFVRMSTAIVEEREEGTLGLLQMTGIRPAALVVGKGLVPLFGACSLVLVQAPFILLCVTLGGVRMDQIGACLVLLLCHFCFLSGMSLFCSSLARTGKGATGLTLGILLFYPYGPIVSEIFLDEMLDLDVHKLTDALWVVNPFRRVFELMDLRTSTTELFSFVESLQLILGAVFFLLAVLVLPRSSRNPLPLGEGRGWFLRRWFRRKDARRTRSPSRPRPENAVFWKDFWFHAGGRVPLLVRLVLLYAVVLPAFLWDVYIRYDLGSWDEFIIDPAGWWFFTWAAFCLELGRACGTVFRSELRQNTFGTLGVLPIPHRQILRAKLRACLLPALVYIPLLLLMAVLNLRKDLFDFDNDETAFALWLLYATIGYGYLVTALSIKLPHGMVPLAAGISFIGLLLTLLAGDFLERIVRMDEELLFPLLSLILFGSTAIALHLWLRKTLRRLLTEGD